MTKVVPKNAQADFIAIATPLIERGFRVTPVHPMTKCGVIRNWSKHQATDVATVKKYAKYFPHHNVGVVGKRGVGRLFVLDIDAEGVLGQIEEETGHKMPQTYGVQSRPQSAPFKKHFYFTQTNYSVTKFGGYESKNINVQDMSTTNDKGGHATRYDLKGSGGGAFVVGAGSVRENGEVYTAFDESPVCKIPDWLVDWIHEDNKKYKKAKDEERKARLKIKKAERERYTEKERAALRLEGDPAGFDIFESDIYWFMRWRAGSFASLGIRPDVIELALKGQVQDFCVGGVAYAASEHGQETIHRVAHEAKLKKNASWFYKRTNLPTIEIESTESGNLWIMDKASQQDVLTEAISSFPDSISASEAYDRLETACAVQGFLLSRRRLADQKAVSRAREAAGFVTRNRDGVFTWAREGLFG